jgi:hypothetical protein
VQPDILIQETLYRKQMSKPELRRKLASLSFSEKIKILEKLRQRSLAIAASGLRPSKTNPTTSDP